MDQHLVDMNSSTGSLTSTAEKGNALDWLISFKNPAELWTDNWFALLLEIVVTCLFWHVCFQATQKHAKSAYLVLTLVCAAIGLEVFQQIPNAGYQLWWYHQGTVNLLQHRVPTYVICFFVVMYYFVDCMNARMNLPVTSQSFVNALSVLVLWYPCQWLVPNLLLLMVHFDDPIFTDTLFGVPCCQMTAMFLLLFHSGHLHNTTFDETDPCQRNVLTYMRCSLQAAVVTATYTIVEVYLLFVTFKLIVDWHTAFCFFTAIGIFGYISKEELLPRLGQGYSISGFSKVMKRQEWRYLLMFFSCLCLVPLLVNPVNLKSNGERLELGPCDAIESVSNMSPLNFFRKRYVCPNDSVHFYDFHCMGTSDMPSCTEVRRSYTICGKPFDRPAQLSRNLAVYAFLTLPFLYAIMAFSLNPDTQTQMRKNCKKID